MASHKICSDRNLLGFRRDLLTAAYGVDRFLYVYGDKPSAGGRTSELTVQAMIEETRAVAEDPVSTGHAPFRAGVTCGLRAVPARNLAGTIPDIDIPEDLVTAVERDRNAGVQAACQ